MECGIVSLKEERVAHEVEQMVDGRIGVDPRCRRRRWLLVVVAAARAEAAAGGSTDDAGAQGEPGIGDQRNGQYRNSVSGNAEIVFVGQNCDRVRETRRQSEARPRTGDVRAGRYVDVQGNANPEQAARFEEKAAGPGKFAKAVQGSIG